VAKILIAAIAGRMLAASARRGGYEVAILDLFNDLDTRRIAPSSLKVPGHEQGLARFSRHALLEAASSLAPGDAYSGLVYGSGFEDDTELLTELARGRRLYGNSAATIQSIKDPRQFFPLLKKRAIPHPEFSLHLPVDTTGWLAKKIGGSGGAHVITADRIEDVAGDHYYQRFIEGKNYSVSFLANRERALIVGFNEPWSIALGDWPYCYLGAINHVSLARTMVARIQRDLDAIVQATGLVGLNGLDFIIAGDDYFVIEVNPRPSGTLDLYDADCAQGLFHWHVRASDGELPERLFDRTVIRAHAVVYTMQALQLDRDVHWPDWCSDIPEPGSAFAPRMPVCMVHAQGDDHEIVQARVHSRREIILSLVQQQAA
jgi:uncharacterized protein